MLKNLFQNIKDSIYNPAYYQKIITETSLRSSMHYFLRLTCALALLVAIILAARVTIFDQKKIADAVNSILSSYPADLVVTVDQGIVSINQPSPYFFSTSAVALPSEASDEFAQEGYENFVVIDTEHQFSTDLFQNYKTAMLITSDSVIVKNKKEIRIMEIGDGVSKVVDQGYVQSLTHKINIFLKALPLFLLVVIFIGCGIGLLFYLIYLVVPAFIIFAAAAVTRAKWTFAKAYQVALHALTLPLILWLLLPVFGVSLKVKFLFTAVLLLVVVVNLYKAKPESAPLVSSEPIA